MTNEDKARLRDDVAEKVMGWVKYYPNPDDKRFWLWRDSEGFTVPDLVWYHETGSHTPPFENAIEWACQVQERISINGLAKEAEYLDALLEIIPFTKLDWEYRKNGSYNLGVTLQYLMVSATPEQRCLAAYKAVTGREWQ